MRVSNSLKPFGFSYDFSRDGGAVGVIPMGVLFLVNRFTFSGIFYTKTGLTGGAGTTVSFGTVASPTLLMNNIAIATFTPNFGTNINFLGFTGFATLTEEEIIMTISVDPITSGNISVSLLTSEFQGL